MARRRNNGEGSITYRDDKDLWVATVQVGYKRLAQSCEPRLRPKTVHDYRGLIDTHIKTAIRKIRLNPLRLDSYTAIGRSFV